MGNKSLRVNEALPLDLARRLDPVCDRFEDAWLARPRIEDFLEDVAEADRPALLRELLWLDLDYRRRGGERPVAEEYRRRLPYRLPRLRYYTCFRQFSHWPLK